MAEKRFNRANAMVVFSAAILVGTEILGAALALGWAVGGLMAWGREMTLALIAICLALGGYAIYAFLRNAIKVEPIFHR